MSSFRSEPVRFREKCTSVPFAGLLEFLSRRKKSTSRAAATSPQHYPDPFRPLSLFLNWQTTCLFLRFVYFSFSTTQNLSPAQDECASRPRAAGCDRNLLWQLVQLHCLYHWCKNSKITKTIHQTLLTQYRRVKQRLLPTKTEVRRLMHAHILANANLSTRPPNPHRPVLRRRRRTPRWPGQAPDCPQCEEHRRILPRFPWPRVGISSLCAVSR